MTNLIPTKAKRDLHLEYWIRVVSVWLMIWSVSLLASASVFLPVYVLIGAQVSANEITATGASEKVADYESVTKLLNQANLQAKIIIDETLLPQFSYKISLIRGLQNEGLIINELVLARQGKDMAPITINGVAKNRQVLSAFRESLLAIEGVASVDLPISNLASDKDIFFTITRIT